MTHQHKQRPYAGSNLQLAVEEEKS